MMIGIIFTFVEKKKNLSLPQETTPPPYVWSRISVATPL